LFIPVEALRAAVAGQLAQGSWKGTTWTRMPARQGLVERK
jgi:hypothetical protein